MMKGKIQHQISNLQWFTFSPNLCEKRSINSSGYDFLSFLFPKEGFTWAPMGKRSVFTKPSHNALDHDYNYNNVSFLFLFFPPLFLCYIKKKKNKKNKKNQSQTSAGAQEWTSSTRCTSTHLLPNLKPQQTTHSQSEWEFSQKMENWDTVNWVTGIFFKNLDERKRGLFLS